MTNAEKAMELLKEAKVFYLATVEADQPRVRPFGAVCVYEDHLYIHTGLGKNVCNQMMENPKVEICAFDKGKTIRITAEAYYDKRTEAQKAMLDANPGLRNMYAEDDGKNAVFMLKNGTVTAGNPKESETFEL